MRSKYYDKDKARVYVYRYRAKNLDKSRRWLMESYARHAERRRQEARDKRKKIQADPVLRAKRNERDRIRSRKRIDTDLDYRTYRRVKNRIRMALQKTYKASRTVELLGCSVAECRKYIESLWTEGMSWENHRRNGWHLDHIIPCYKFDLTDPEQQKRCFHYTNLQPLWCLDNWRKDGRPKHTYRKR